MFLSKILPMNKIVLLCVLVMVCVCVQAVSAVKRPHTLNMSYHDVQGLTTPASYDAASRRWKQALEFLHPETGKHIKLHYDAIHTDQPIVSLDTLHDVHSVECNPESETLTVTVESLTSGASLKLIPGTLIVGSREWRCTFNKKNTIPNVIMRRIVSILTTQVHGESNQAVIQLKTEHTGISEFFEHATVRASISAFPHGHVQEIVHSDTTQDDSRRQLSQAGWWPFDIVKKFIQSVCKKVKEFAHEVAEVVKVVEKVVELLVTGDYDAYQTIPLGSISWNLNTDVSVKIEDKARDFIQISESVTCDNCFAKLDATVNFEMHIKDYSLSAINTVLDSSANLHISGAFNATTSSSGRKLIGTIHVKPICFVIGVVPVCITTTIPVNVGFEATVSLVGDSQFNAGLTGTLRYGFGYTNIDGFHLIHDDNLTHIGDFASHVALSASARIFVEPTFVFAVDHIGSVNVGLRPYGELTVLYDNSNNNTSNQCYSKLTGIASPYAFNIGLEISVGGALNITLGNKSIFSKTFEPKLVKSFKMPVKSGCLGTPSHVASLGSGNNLVGVMGVPSAAVGEQLKFFTAVAYLGEVTPLSKPSCSTLQPFTIAMQYIEDGTDLAPPQIGRWVGTINSHLHLPFTSSSAQLKYDVRCVVQQQYITSSFGSDPHVFTFQAEGQLTSNNASVNDASNDDAAAVYMSACTEDNYMRTVFDSASAFMSSDLSTLSISLDTECLQSVVLTRESKL